jgi:hypothetical protein
MFNSIYNPARKYRFNILSLGCGIEITAEYDLESQDSYQQNSVSIDSNNRATNLAVQLQQVTELEAIIQN